MLCFLIFLLTLFLFLFLLFPYFVPIFLFNSFLFLPIFFYFYYFDDFQDVLATERHGTCIHLFLYYWSYELSYIVAVSMNSRV